MAKPFPKIGPYSVIADTNALYSRNSSELVSGGFEAALTELRKLATLQLYIPDVVIGELAYQKFEAAAAAIAAVEKNLTLLAEIGVAKRPTLCSVEQAKKRIKRRYVAWCRAVNAHRIVPKVQQAAWSKIVEDAIWRIPPFERSEGKKQEKGFRDRVVLEAVVQLCSKTANESILLSEDG